MIAYGMVKFARTNDDTENLAAQPLLATKQSAGLDLCAQYGCHIQPGEVKSVGTGLAVEIPEGFVGLFCARSSLHKKDLQLANSLGIIDSDYRGELVAKLYNFGDEVVEVEAGERIVQLVLIPHLAAMPELVDYDELGATDRGSGGFGSTGK